MVCTVSSVASRGERHNTRRNAPSGPRLGRAQILLLVSALYCENTTGCRKVRWQPLIRRIAARGRKGTSRRSLANALRRLEERLLVDVSRPSKDLERKGRFTDYFELTEAGRQRARELWENRGVTRATAERKQRSRDRLAAVRSWWSKERKHAEALVLSDPGLINDLERLYGSEPQLGGGTPTEEAAKRFLLLARTRFFQDFVRHELADARAVVEDPTPAGQHLIGVEMVWRGDGPFDPNDPLTRQQLDLIAALFKSRSSQRDD